MNFSVDRDVDIYLSTEFEFDQCTNKKSTEIYYRTDKQKDKNMHSRKLIFFPNIGLS